MDCSKLYEPTTIREYEDSELSIKYKCTVCRDDDIIRQYTSAAPPGLPIDYNGVLMGRLNSKNPQPLPPPPDVFVLLFRYKYSLVGEDNSVLSMSDIERSECFWIKKKLLLSDGNNAFCRRLAQIINCFDSILMFHDAYGMVNDIIEFARNLEQANLKHGHKGVSFVYHITACQIWNVADQIIKKLQELYMRTDQESSEDDDGDDEEDEDDDDITSTSAVASELLIESLRKGEFEGDGKASCMVCLEEILKGEEVMWMPCTHYYHGGCIIKWLGTSNICPLCRFLLPQESLN